MPKQPPELPETLTREDVRHIRDLWLQGVSVAELAEKFEQTREYLWNVLEGERSQVTTDTSRILECSFCGATQTECAMLIAGQRAYICNQCVQICVEIIMEARPGDVRIEIGPPSTFPSPGSDGDGQDD